jgi:hypothetical protein
VFGRKPTRPDNHFLGNAVYGLLGLGPKDEPTPIHTWYPMEYPLDYPYETQTMDLAFVITPEPGTLVLLASGGWILLAYAWRSRRWR